MRKSDVLAYYDGNGAAAARAVGVTRSAFHQWPELIPEVWAHRYERVTGSGLKVDPANYPITPIEPVAKAG